MTSMREINYNVDGRKISGKSNLGKIQMDLIQVCLTKRPENLSKMQDFLVTNPNMMDTPMMYSNLEQVGISYQQALHQIDGLQNTQNIGIGIVR